MSEGKPMIYSAICGVMEDVGYVGKDSKNQQQGFKYRSIDAVMNALNPAMIKNKIFCVPEVLEQTREERTTSKGSNLIYSICRMRYRFFAVDGSYVDAVVVGEGMDSGDKATNKAMAIAFKYACFQTFCIATESLMDDPDVAIPEQSGKNSKAPKPADDAKKKLCEELSQELMRTGYTWQSVCKTYKVDSAENLTQLQLKDCINKMKKLSDKAVS
jgi:ERF superfamily.